MVRNQAWPENLSVVLAFLMAAFSAFAILNPDLYAQEQDAWKVQVVVQDWVNLVLVAPLLVISAWRSRRGSVTARLILGGALMYGVYNLVIYAFAVHYNVLFLAYTTALGLATFALIGVFARGPAMEASARFGLRTRVRFPAIVLVVLAFGFAVLWLLEIVATILDGGIPASLEGTGLWTNPVHALDLSVTLPSLALSGLLLWRRHPWGFVLAPMMLTFAVVTDVAIVAIIVASVQRGLPGEIAVAVGIGFTAAVTFAALLSLLATRREPPKLAP